MKLFMVLLGCTPKGRNTEQHDVFFGIGESIKDLVPDMIAFWPEAKGKLHLDGYRAVTNVNGFSVEVVAKGDSRVTDNALFFLNLGGYKPEVFDELHYKILIVGSDKATAIAEAKQSAFYKHTGFKGATSHIDDKYGVDVDDVFEIKDVLSKSVTKKYSLQITQQPNLPNDEIHLGYIPFSKVGC